MMSKEDENTIKFFLAMAFRVAFIVGGAYPMADAPKLACNIAEEMVHELKTRGWEMPKT
jgi:hypothetical protein